MQFIKGDSYNFFKIMCLLKLDINIIVFIASVIILLLTPNIAVGDRTAEQRFDESVKAFKLADEKARKGKLDNINAKDFEVVIKNLDIAIPDLKDLMLGRALLFKASCYYWMHLSKLFNGQYEGEYGNFDPFNPPAFPLVQEGLSYAIKGRKILEEYPAGIVYHPWANDVVKKLESYLPYKPSMDSKPSTASKTVAKPTEKLLNELRTKDHIINSVSSQVRKIFPSIASKHVGKRVDFYVLDNTDETENCIALIHGFETPKIICNANLFYEIEAAIRAFVINQQELPDEKALFNLAQDIQSGPKEYLTKLRKLHGNFKDTNSLDNQIIEQMKLIMLFLIAHELGHIKDASEGRYFINTFNPDTPLEEQAAIAVVRMCRHVEDFDRLGYGLSFLKEASNLKSKIRNVELQFREQMLIAYENHDQWYKDEVSADAFAVSIILQHINGMKKINALESEHYFISNLFFMSFYYLYKDIYNFSMKACGISIINSVQLSLCMARSREQYIKAASIFGDIHMFFLLRSILAIDKIMEHRKGYFGTDGTISTIWISQNELEKMDAQKRMITIWHYTNLQKYVFLSILMDTPVKLAYVGCSTGWLIEMDKKRGTGQGLLVEFETIEQAYQRLLKKR